MLLLPILALGLFFVLPVYAAVPAWLAVAAACWYVRLVIHRSVRFPPRTGIESMAGREATVVDPVGPAGTIRYQGEVWRAASPAPLESGAKVRIVQVVRLPEGFTAIVERLDPGAGAKRGSG
jgi:membrane-bound ClpP family serine protease